MSQKLYCDPKDHDAVVQRCKDAILDLAWDYPFFGMAAARVINKITVESRIPTAAVNKRGRIYVNPEFVASLTHGELAWVMAHEICHPLMGHAERQRGRVHQLWNIAGDKAINCNLEDGFRDSNWIHAPRSVQPLLPDQESWGWAAERIYDRELKDYQEQEQQSGGSGDSGGSGGDGGDGDAQDNPFAGQPGVGEGCGIVEDPEDLDDPDDDDGRTDSDIEREWRETAIQSAHQQKTVGRGAGSALARIAEVPEPKVPWSKVLRKGLAIALAGAGKSQKSWRRRGRRSQTYGDFILPGWMGTKAKVAVVIDTSGSMSDAALAACVAETQAAARESGIPVYLVTHDHDVQWEGWIRPTTKVSEIKATLVGRGGTCAREAYRSVETPLSPRAQAKGSNRKSLPRRAARFDVFVHLTDCCLSWPDWPSNTRKRIVARVEASESLIVPDGAEVFDVDVEGTY